MEIRISKYRKRDINGVNSSIVNHDDPTKHIDDILGPWKYSFSGGETKEHLTFPALAEQAAEVYPTGDFSLRPDRVTSESYVHNGHFTQYGLVPDDDLSTITVLILSYRAK